jgi:hypothetical protein
VGTKALIIEGLQYAEFADKVDRFNLALRQFVEGPLFPAKKKVRTKMDLSRPLTCSVDMKWMHARSAVAITLCVEYARKAFKLILRSRILTMLWCLAKGAVYWEIGDATWRAEGESYVRYQLDMLRLSLCFTSSRDCTLTCKSMQPAGHM